MVRDPLVRRSRCSTCARKVKLRRTKEMTQTKPNPLVRLMPSLTDVAFLLPVIFLFTRLEGIRTMLHDGDTGWHIRIGEWILKNGRVPTSDLFSFTRPDA